MRAQNDARGGGVEGIPHVARRMVGRDVEQAKVKVIRFDVG